MNKFNSIINNNNNNNNNNEEEYRIGKYRINEDNDNIQ